MDVKVNTGVQDVTLKGAKSMDEAVQFAGQQLFGKDNFRIGHQFCCEDCDGNNFFESGDSKVFFSTEVVHDEFAFFNADSHQVFDMADLHQFFQEE